jgi:hypothetical protein
MSFFPSHRLFRLGLSSALCIAPASVMAQAPNDLVEPIGAPDAPPAATAPSPPLAQPGSTPATAKAPSPARTPQSVGDQTLETDDEPGKHKKKKKHKNKDGAEARDQRDDRGDRDADASSFTFGSVGGTLQVKGRIFALSELSHRRETIVGTTGMLEERDRNALDLSLASARFGFEYRSPLRWLSLDLELEVAGKPQVKDAYVLAGKRFFVKAGQFKVPTAALELESPWTLPLVRRGLVHDLLSDWLDVAGRRPGVAFGYRGKGALKPRLTLGAFQGTTLSQVTPGDRDVDLIEQASLDSQSLAARGELSLLGFDVGAWYEHRVGSKAIGEFEHYETVGLDATLDHTFQNAGLRLWLDGGLGESFYVAKDKPGDDQEPLFATARALIGYRFGGVLLGDPYIEPFGHFSLLDPDLEVVEDFATEAALGVNVGFWDRARVSLQGEMTSAQRNFPVDLLDNQNPDRLSLLLQAGARF